MDAEIAEQLARRDRFRRHQWRLLTPTERVANLDALQRQSAAVLQANPETYERWFRRNWSARAASRSGG